MNYRSRYYETGTGRFLQQDGYLGDELAPASLHRYVYVFNDPVRFADPTGNIVTRLITDITGWILIASGLSMVYSVIKILQSAIEAQASQNSSQYIIDPTGFWYWFLLGWEEIVIAGYAGLFIGMGQTLLSAEGRAQFRGVNQFAGSFPISRALGFLAQLRAPYLPAVVLALCAAALRGLFQPIGTLSPFWPVSAALCFTGTVGAMSAIGIYMGP